MNITPDYTLCFVTDENLSQGRSSILVSEEALKGGATIIQLRDKGKDKSFLIETGKVLHELCTRYNALFIVNDSVELAQLLHADGIHLGQSDLPIKEARAIMGGDAIIGISVTTIEEALLAERDSADYLGAGPILATASKHDAEQPIGIDGLKQIVASVTIPVTAIGGIQLSNTSDIAKTGVAGIAVITAISAAADIKASTASLVSTFNRYHLPR